MLLGKLFKTLDSVGPQQGPTALQPPRRPRVKYVGASVCAVCQVRERRCKQRAIGPRGYHAARDNRSRQCEQQPRAAARTSRVVNSCNALLNNNAYAVSVE